jgi:hypothetical protein
MKILIWSAFAVSLILISPKGFAQTEAIDDFLGLEMEILPELKGKQRFTTTELHEKESWQVLPQNVEVDLPEPNKGQKHSIIPWSTQDPEEWLSIDNWLIDRAIKDETPDWKIRLRESDHSELVGKILQCIGLCEVYRGTNKTSVQHLSRLIEGDEVRTAENSIAWVFMMDGSLVRISPETSVSLNEFNLASSEILILLRLNQGHIFWHPRKDSDFLPDLAPETDAISIPLMVRSANQQFFEREIYQSQKDAGHLSEVMSLDENAILQQYKSLNTLRGMNSAAIKAPTRVMVVAPNGSIVSKEVSFDFLHVPGGKSLFKKRNTEEGEEFSLHLRGYATSEPVSLVETNWFEVDPTGRTYTKIDDVPATLQILELLTKRIKTIELAREIWTRDFSIPVFNSLTDPRKLARDYGYSLWDDKQTARFNFLVEYTRRIETTNLRSVENLLTKLENSGEKVSRELPEEQYQVSLNHYLLGLKSRYDKKKMRVRDMNDLQYYVWILKHGKL